MAESWFADIYYWLSTNSIFENHVSEWFRTLCRYRILLLSFGVPHPRWNSLHRNYNVNHIPDLNLEWLRYNLPIPFFRSLYVTILRKNYSHINWIRNNEPKRCMCWALTLNLAVNSGFNLICWLSTKFAQSLVEHTNIGRCWQRIRSASASRSHTICPFKTLFHTKIL